MIVRENSSHGTLGTPLRTGKRWGHPQRSETVRVLYVGRRVQYGERISPTRTEVLLVRPGTNRPFDHLSTHRPCRFPGISFVLSIHILRSVVWVSCVPVFLVLSRVGTYDSVSLKIYSTKV